MISRWDEIYAENLSRFAVGSAPGDKIKMIGVLLRESLYMSLTDPLMF